MSLLDNLRKNREEIANLDCASQTVKHERAKWTAALANFPEWNELMRYLQLGPNDPHFSLSRRLVVNMVSLNETVKLRFLAQMIWGHGPGSNRGPSSVARLMAQPNLEDKLQRAVDKLKGADLDGAFRCLDIEGLGMSYRTKLLYFEGAHLQPPEHLQPLIFDNLVANAMVQLAVDSKDGWLLESVLIQRGNHFADYYVYLEKLHRIGTELSGVTPEQLEYWLWLRGRKLGVTSSE